jgi:hypothetical protein
MAASLLASCVCALTLSAFPASAAGISPYRVFTTGSGIQWQSSVQDDDLGFLPVLEDDRSLAGAGESPTTILHVPAQGGIAAIILPTSGNSISLYPTHQNVNGESVSKVAEPNDSAAIGFALILMSLLLRRFKLRRPTHDSKRKRVANSLAGTDAAGTLELARDARFTTDIFMRATH